MGVFFFGWFNLGTWGVRFMPKDMHVKILLPRVGEHFFGKISFFWSRLYMEKMMVLNMKIHSSDYSPEFHDALWVISNAI